ncbi:MAG: mucoidy inhibitor MuiA family protein [bacterium]|nr:mucoidy inhibitor MuiA family protein [bacterium]
MNELETTVKKVTLFPDRARLTRECSISLEEGNHRLEINHLPLAIEPESVRVHARGTARARIKGVDVNKTFFKDVPPGHAQEISNRIKELEDQDRVFVDELESLEGQVKHLDGLFESTRTYARSMATGKSTIESHNTVIDFITDKRSAARAKMRENSRRRRDLDDKIKQLKNKVAQIRGTLPKERYRVEIDIDITKAGDLDIELTYMFSDAYWKPLYDVRLADESLEIGYLAEVRQSSGEDWRDVTLTLSTARPSTASTIPELDPWYVSVYRPTPPPPLMAAPAGMHRKGKFRAAAAAQDLSLEAEMLEEETFAGAAPEIMEVETATADISQTGTTVSYEAGDKADIPGNGSPHKCTITLFKLKPEFDYVIAPKLEELAYRRIYAVNDSPYVLLPGPAQLFDGDDYIGAVAFELIAPGQKIKLYFGTDNRIHVKRELVNRETEKKFMAEKRRIRFAYEITLENHTGEPQTVTVCDQIPVSKHESIKVKLENTEPDTNEKDELNRLKWKLLLKAGAKERLRLDFSVEYPGDTTVGGLN